MRIAFVSDIHGNLAALDAVIADIARRLYPLPWLHVAGNHERQVLRLPLGSQNASDAYTTDQLAEADKSWLAGHADPCDPRLHSGQVWPEQLGPAVALCHGSPRSDIEYLLETSVGDGAHALRTGWMPR